MSTFLNIVGLDFGSDSLKAAWLQLRSGELVVQRTEQLALPADAAEAQRLALSWIERHDLHRQPCALALGGSQCVFQPGRLPVKDPRSPQQAAEMEVATFNDLAGDRMLHDVAAFSLDETQRQYLIAMARPSFVDRALQMAATYNLRVVDLVPAPIAVYNWHERASSARKHPRLHIHVGGNQTEIAIGLPDGLLFARAVAMGGNAFTVAIAQARKLAASKAEHIKLNKASLAPGQPLADVLQPVADRLASQIASGLAVYKSQFPDAAFTIGDVCFSGGGARLGGLTDQIRNRLTLPAAVPAAEAPEVDPIFDVACGLAATSLQAGPTYLSLLPQRLRNEVIFGVKKPYWVATGIFVALSLGVFTISGLRGLRRESEELRAESAELHQLEQAAQNIERQRRRAQQVRRNASPLREMLRSGPLTRDLISLVARSIHPDDWISMICDEDAYVRAPTTSPEARPSPRRLPGMRDLGARRDPAPRTRTTPPAPPMRNFIVEGYTPDPSLVTVKDLIARLQNARMVDNADLLGDDRVLAPRWFEGEPPSALTNLTHFVVRVELRQP